MKVFAVSVKNKVIVTLSDNSITTFRLERVKHGDNEWSCLTANGFTPLSELSEEVTPVEVSAGDFLDNFNISDGLYEYRICDFAKLDPIESDYKFTSWVRCGDTGGIGYTFGNYKAPEGGWGTAVTVDDCRYTYLWGTDFKAANGTSYTDEQIQYFIDAATQQMARQLNIDIVKTRYRTEPESRGLVKGEDYDKEEEVYDFKYSKIERYGIIKTRHKPILKLHKLDMLSRFHNVKDLVPTTIVQKQTGTLKMLERPLYKNDTYSGIDTAISPYGNQTLSNHLFYKIDYDAGYENSDEIPADLREVIGKQAAISLLNIIGDGLMSGFSSSSLSMDGVSESFSSTQSATSAYFGARIAEYKKDIETYLKENKKKFANMVIGSL